MGIYVGNYLVIVRMCLFFVIAPQMRNHLLAISRHSFRHCETYEGSRGNLVLLLAICNLSSLRDFGKAKSWQSPCIASGAFLKSLTIRMRLPRLTS